MCRYKVHAYSSGAIEQSEASVSLYGVKKEPIKFVINRDGQVNAPLPSRVRLPVTHAPRARRCTMGIGTCSTSRWTNKVT